MIDALVSGGGDADVVRTLRETRLSRHLFLLRAVLDVVSQSMPTEVVTRFETTYAALGGVQRNDPWVVADILAHPHVGAWLAWCLRRLRGHQQATTPLHIDLAHLGAITAAAAMRCGSQVEVEAPVRSGAVAIPTLGRMRLGGSEPWRLVRLDCRKDLLVVHGGQSEPPVTISTAVEGPYWEVLRRVEVTSDGLTFRVEVDDIDPYRDCHGLGATERLAADVWSQWATHIAQAWDVIVANDPQRAAAIGAGVSVLVPLAQDRHSVGTSATPATAPGAVALTPPVDGLSLAVTLVHELQHTKLNILLNLVPCIQPDDDLYYSPWRDDPRPLWGLLHGTYAFFAVAEFWHAVRRNTSDSHALADFEFARVVQEVCVGQRALAASDKFTAEGSRLVTTIGDVVTQWVEDLPADVGRITGDLVADHRAKWRLRNLVPDPGDVAALAAAWRARAVAPPMTHRAATLPSTQSSGNIDADDVRLRLARWHAVNPERRTEDGSNALPVELDEATTGDRHLAAGDYPRAVQAYLESIVDSPTAAGWAGLAVASGRLGGSPAAAVLSRAPELVRAVTDLLAANGDRPDNVLDIAAWLSTSST